MGLAVTRAAAILCALLLSNAGCYANHGGAEAAFDAGVVGADAVVELHDASLDAGEDTWDCQPDDAAGFIQCMNVKTCAEWTIRCESRRRTTGVEWSSYPVRACHPRLSTAEDDFVQIFVESVAAGRIALDPAAARTCFAWQLDRCPDHAPRDDYWPADQPVECEQMLVGSVPLGAACRLREECAGAERWAATCDRSRACPGVCVELPALGEPCEWPLLCRWPLLCGSGGTCVAGAEGDGCLDWRDCWPPLLCASDAGGAQACRAPPGEGERCVASCAAGLYCLGEVCVRPAPLGARCDDRPCADGLRCEGGQCARIVAPGDECDGSTRVCPTGLSCADGRCAPLPAAGEACDDARPCVEGQCVTGVCSPAEPGSPCDPSSLFGECAGYCAPSVERCQPSVSEGGSCAGSEQCAEGLVCVANLCVRCGSP